MYILRSKKIQNVRLLLMSCNLCLINMKINWLYHNYKSTKSRLFEVYAMGYVVHVCGIYWYHEGMMIPRIDNFIQLKKNKDSIYYVNPFSSVVPWNKTAKATLCRVLWEYFLTRCEIPETNKLLLSSRLLWKFSKNT